MFSFSYRLPHFEIDLPILFLSTTLRTKAGPQITKLKEEGIDIVAGSDAAAGLKGTGVGPSLWMELELLIERCGFTIMEALHSATALPARRLGFDDRGRVTVGRRADLVLVKGNVMERLQTLWEGEGIVGVWKEGLKAG